MTHRTNAAIAGVTYLAYIGVAYPGMVLMSRATRGDGIPSKLATIAQHESDIRVVVILSFLSALCAIVLAVTLYAITRDEDQEIALLGLTCRAGEGVVGAVSIIPTLGVLLAAASSSADPAGTHALAAFLLKFGDLTTMIAASFFAVGSTLFSYLLLRGRIVPAPLAALGLLGSLVIAIGLPVQMAGYFTGSVTQMMWLPVGGFEILVALWLIIKGAALPRVAKPAGE